VLKLISRVGGARFGGWLGQESAGGSLQSAQIFSGRFKNFATWLSKDKAEQLINDAILSRDPKLLQSLLLPLNKPSRKWGNLLEFKNNLNLWFLGTGKRVIDEIENEMQEGN